MGAWITKPLGFSIIAAPQLPTAPATNLMDDHPGKVWVSPNVSSIVIDILGDGSTIDTIALVGSDLTAADTLQLRFASTQAGLDTATPLAAVAGFSGSKASNVSTITLNQFSARSFQYVRLTISLSSSRPVTAQRLVVGSAVTTLGIDYGCEQTFNDQSVPVGGVGYTAWEQYSVLPAWKFKVSGISYADWRAKWFPLLSSVGRTRAILFSPDDSVNHQHDLTFGRITSNASGSPSGYNWWVADLAIMALAP